MEIAMKWTVIQVQVECGCARIIRGYSISITHPATTDAVYLSTYGTIP